MSSPTNRKWESAGKYLTKVPCDTSVIRSWTALSYPNQLLHFQCASWKLWVNCQNCQNRLSNAQKRKETSNDYVSLLEEHMFAIPAGCDAVLYAKCIHKGEVASVSSPKQLYGSRWYLLFWVHMRLEVQAVYIYLEDEGSRFISETLIPIYQATKATNSRRP
jgi:hypothetical protein